MADRIVLRTVLRTLCLPTCILLVFAGLGGCSGGSATRTDVAYAAGHRQDQPTAGTGQPADPRGLPQALKDLRLPLPSDNLGAIPGVKGASYESGERSGRFCYGRGFLVDEPYQPENVEVSFNDALFQPNGGLAHATYQFRFNPDELITWPLYIIYFNGVFDLAHTQMWLGLANWRLNRWDWFQRDESNWGSFVVPPPDRLLPYMRYVPNSIPPHYDLFVTLVLVGGGEEPRPVLSLRWCRLGSNTSPVADLWAIEEGDLRVYFCASQSFSYDGELIQFDWDWENDGVWDLEEASVYQTHYYAEPGEYTAAVRVHNWDWDPWWPDPLSYDIATVHLTVF